MTYKALLIGICYKGRVFKSTNETAELWGSHRDVLQVKKMLIEKASYSEKDITMLLDDGIHASPTRASIIAEMKKLVADAKAGDHMFFHFSGHGVQVVDVSGDEKDGYDEAIWPLDYEEENEDTYIIDDDMRAIMVDRTDPAGLEPLPPGCQLTALFDSCHSGTALDLPVDYFGTPRAKPIELPPESPIHHAPHHDMFRHEHHHESSSESQASGHHHQERPGSTVLKILSGPFVASPPRVLPVNTEASHGLLGLPYSAQSRARGAPSRKATLVVAMPDKPEVDASKAFVTSWAACADDENAYELKGGEGAMVEFFVESIYSIKHLTYGNLLESLSEKLANYCENWNRDKPPEEQIKQIPQMGSLHEIDLKASFAL